MPIRKFRSLEEWQESKRELWLDCDDPRLPDRIRALWSQRAGYVPLNAPRGVRKYRSFEEMCADRDKWEQERINHIRATRVRTK